MSSQPGKTLGQGPSGDSKAGYTPRAAGLGAGQAFEWGRNWIPSLRSLLFITDEAGRSFQVQIMSPGEPLNSPSACLPPRRRLEGACLHLQGPGVSPNYFHSLIFWVAWADIGVLVDLTTKGDHHLGCKFVSSLVSLLYRSCVQVLQRWHGCGMPSYAPHRLVSDLEDKCSGEVVANNLPTIW